MEKRFYTFNDTTSVDSGQIFKNFTKGKKLPSSITSRTNLFVTVELEDNEKIEYIALKYYKTMNYWDILMLLNEMTDITALPKDMDSLLQKVDTELLNHLEYFKISDYTKVEDLGFVYDYSDALKPKLTNPINQNGDDIILENAKIYTVENYDENKILKFTKNQSTKIFEGTSYGLIEPLELVEKRVPISETGLILMFKSETDIRLINETTEDIALVGGWYYSFEDEKMNEYKIKKSINTVVAPGAEYRIIERLQPLSAIDDYTKIKRQELIDELTIKNEKFRTFKIVKPDKITEFLKEIDDYIVALRVADEQLK